MNIKLGNLKEFNLLCYLLFIGLGWVDSSSASTSCPGTIPAGTVFNNPNTGNIQCDSPLMEIKGTLNNYGSISGRINIKNILNNYGRMDVDDFPISTSSGNTINQQGGIINIACWLHVYSSKAGALTNYGTINLGGGTRCSDDFDLLIMTPDTFRNYGTFKVDLKLWDGQIKTTITNYGILDITPQGSMTIGTGYNRADYIQTSGKTIVNGSMTVTNGSFEIKAGSVLGTGILKAANPNYKRIGVSNSTISPGTNDSQTNIGKLTLDGYLVMGSGSINLEIYGSTSDQLNIDRMCAFGGAINIMYKGGAIARGTTYDVLKVRQDDLCNGLIVNLPSSPIGITWRWDKFYDGAYYVWRVTAI